MLALRIFSICIAFSLSIFTNAFAKTYPTTYYNDPAADFSYAFGIYKTVKGIYSDPSFEKALSISSPFQNAQLQNFDVVVVINIDNSVDVVTGAPIQGQTLRVYAKESFVRTVGVKHFEETNYDPTTGLLFYWKVSTARAGKETPRGYFRPQAFSSDHRSSIYDDAFMPWAVFFNGGIATHGTFGDSISNLGQKASAGCVRLEPQRAKDLFHLMGFSKNTLIVVQ